MKDYLLQGAKWTTAPKPLMSNALYDFEFTAKSPEEQEALVAQGQYVTTEFEPCFDAADIVRFGRDIFVQRSHVTNMMGITWLKQHLGEQYRVHIVPYMDRFRGCGSYHIRIGVLSGKPKYNSVIFNPANSGRSDDD